MLLAGVGRAFSAGGDFGFIEDRIAGTVEGNEEALKQLYHTFLQVQGREGVQVWGGRGGF